MGCNLLVKNWDDSVDDVGMEDLFAQLGTVISAKVSFRKLPRSIWKTKLEIHTMQNPNITRLFVSGELLLLWGETTVAGQRKPFQFAPT